MDTENLEILTEEMVAPLMQAEEHFDLPQDGENVNIAFWFINLAFM